MQYQSIKRFFDYSGIEYSIGGEFNLSRAKKLIAAEFAMQPDGIIVVDNIHYTKQEIFAELERHDLEERLQFHCIIWQRKGLLALLEQDTFNFNDENTWFSLHKTQGFVSFVSPYFAEVYNRVMRSFLNNSDLSSAAAWLDYLHFIETGEEEEALRNVRIYLAETIRFFKNLNDQSYKSRDEELRIWYTTSWSPFINKLPDSLLPYVDDIVSAIINFSVRIQKSNKKICYKISKELLNVNNANYTLIQLVRSNHEAYKQNYKRKTLSGWLRSGLNAGYVIMFVIFGIVRLFMSDTKDSNSGFDSYADRNKVYESMEITSYRAARNLYKSNYGGYEHGFYMAKQNISEAFDAKETYLIVEAPKDSSRIMSPFSIKNITTDTIQFHMLRGGYVSHFDMAPQHNFSFKPQPYQTVDMFIEFGNTGNLSSIPFNASNEMHLLHIGIEDAPNDTAYSFNDDVMTEIPYYDNKELAELPLVITISKRQGKYFFSLKGNGNILFQKGNDITVSQK